MTESKKLISLAVIGAAIAGLMARLRHRSDTPSPPEKGAENGRPTTPR
jgi:hypothetical protein